MIDQSTLDARSYALRIAPSRKPNPIGGGPDISLTATEIIAEAEIIYQWIIKPAEDLPKKED